MTWLQRENRFNRGVSAMTLEEAERRIVERMTPAERAAHEQGCQIVDWYFSLLDNPNLPASTRQEVREKLRAFAHRQPHETVSDIDGRPKN
jgi:hypothetical protein